MKLIFKNIENYDAVLCVDDLNATPLLKQVAYGTIFEDSKGRFPDGSKIRTSEIQELVLDDNGVMFIQTLNTVYKVSKG